MYERIYYLISIIPIQKMRFWIINFEAKCRSLILTQVPILQNEEDQFCEEMKNEQFLFQKSFSPISCWRV